MADALVQVQFQGVDEGSDPKALPPGAMLRAENVAMDKHRRLVKRLGTTRLPIDKIGGGSMGSGERLITRGNELAVFDGASVFSYSAALSAWRQVDRVSSLMVERQWLADASRSVILVDSAIYASATGIRVTMYMTYAQVVFYTVEEVSTGTILVPPTSLGLVSAAGGIRVLVSGTTAYLLHSIADKVRVQTLNLSTLVLSAVTDLVTDATNSVTSFDAVIGNNASSVATLYLCYGKQGGNARAASFTLSTFAQVQNYDMAGTGTCLSFAVSYGTNIAYAVSSSTLNLCKMVTYDKSLAGVTGALTTVLGLLAVTITLIDRGDGTNVVVLAQHNTAGTSAETIKTSMWNYTTMVEVASSARYTYGLYGPSKMFSLDARLYCAATMFLHSYTAGSTDPFPSASVILIEIETANSITGVVGAPHRHAATLENQTGWFSDYAVAPPSVAFDVSGNAWVCAARRNIEPSTGFYQRISVGWGLFKVTGYDGNHDLAGSVECMGSAFCWAAAPFWYDGDSGSPYGFATAPIILTTAASVGGAIVNGTYSYRILHTWRDANGVTHRSIPSPPKTGASAGGNQTITPVSSSSSLSSRQRTVYGTAEPNAVLVEPYRTTIGGTSVHYRLVYEPLWQVLLNDPQSPDVSVADARADANITGGGTAITLASRKQLYTDTGELDDVPPPAFLTGALHRGRIIGLGPDRRTAWASKDFTQDAEVAPGFNEALVLAFASDKYAFASLDEKLVAFGKSDIDLVHGNGPDATGQGNDWQIQRVQSDVGTTNPRSVATTPLGVTFQSARGIEMLDRGLNVIWIGRPIEDTLADYPIITSAVLVATEEEIRFTCTDSAGETGIVLAYDYIAKIWFTRVYKFGEATGAAFADAKLVGGVYTMLTYDGEVYQETTATKLDYGSNYVGIDVILAPLSASGNLAWTRVKDVTIMGTSVTNHNLKVSVARDYATSYEQDTTFLAGSEATTIGPLEKCRLSMQNQKCQAIQVRIQDITPTSPGTYPVSTGDGPILESLAFRVSKRPGVAKTSAGQRG